MEIKKGIGVSPGVVISTAVVLDAEDCASPSASSRPEQVPVEVERLNHAIADSVVELAQLRESVTSSVGKEIGEIFAVHLGILGDRGVTGDMVNEIRKQQCTANTRSAR
jgi:phosphoenolpyruvate-protein kinase (PTS system EI component)